MAVVVCTLSAQDQAGQHFGTDAGGAQETLPLAEELLAVDGFWEGGKVSGMRPLVGYPHIRRWIYTHVPIGGTNWT